MRLHDDTEIETLIPAGSYSATQTGTGVDMRDYVGEIKAILDAAAMSTGDTLDVKLQESSDDGSSDAYADIPGATFTQVTDAAAAFEAIGVNIGERERYIRAVGTIGGSTITAVYAVHLVGTKKYR